MSRAGNLWATKIESMPPEDRTASKQFSPYVVTPDGALRLPFELLPVNRGPNQWPIGPAPGWTRHTQDTDTPPAQWRALGSKSVIEWVPTSPPIPTHKAPSWGNVESSWLRRELPRLIQMGKAVPFCGQLFLLPDPECFVMNSFRYEVPKMAPLSIFVGYRGQPRKFPESITPGIHRSSNVAHLRHWETRARICGNVLKQRFLEQENKPLTELEAIGVMQHHYIIGPTDVVDLTYDINVAKWFALNEFVERGYVQKKFAKNDRAQAIDEASRVYTVVVRSIPSLPLDEAASKVLTAGLTVSWWRDLATMESSGPARLEEAPPSNLAPLWSDFPKQQSGFGLRGICESDTDPCGSILSVVEHAFHPICFPNGWDHIGGPELTIDGRQFSYEDDSSVMTDFLFPRKPNWLRDAAKEAKQLLNV